MPIDFFIFQVQGSVLKPRDLRVCLLQQSLKQNPAHCIYLLGRTKKNYFLLMEKYVNKSTYKLPYHIKSNQIKTCSKHIHMLRFLLPLKEEENFPLAMKTFSYIERGVGIDVAAGAIAIFST